MTDSERLDALGDYGLCIATHDTFKHGSWEKCWVCCYNIGAEQRTIIGDDIRSVIDSAILDFKTLDYTEH